MDCSPPGSCFHGISQARMLEWVAISFSRESSQRRDQTQVKPSLIAKGRSGTLPTTFLLQEEVVETPQAHISPLRPSPQVLGVTSGELARQPPRRKSLPPLSSGPPSVRASGQHVLFCFQGQEQDVKRIIQALHECLAALPRQQLRKVCGIGVSGQMHGVMFWKTGQGMLGLGAITFC